MAPVAGERLAGEEAMALFEQVAAEFRTLLLKLDDLERDVGILVKKATGVSWDRIGEAAGGISYQAAGNRYVPRGRRPATRKRPDLAPEPTNAELQAEIAELRRLLEAVLNQQR